MNLRGLVLIGFSGLCLLAAGLAENAQDRRSLSSSLASATAPSGRDCMRQSINTASGIVGCFQPVSAVMGRAIFGSDYKGGSALWRGH